MNPIQSAIGVGLLLLVTGILIVLAGLYLVRKFRFHANYSGIGGFRLTREGIAWLAGYLLAIFGCALVFASVLLVFL